MKKLSLDALHVLEHKTLIEGQLVRITGTLDRKLYIDINSALEALGGKRNRSKKAHVFESSPSDKIMAVIAETGFVDVKKELEQFYTPTDLAQMLVELAGVTPGMWCLEPSAGRGSIARALRDARAHVMCVEIDPTNVEHLIKHGFEVDQTDFLNFTASDVDRVVMNPPFSGDGDVDHVLHAHGLLKPSGKLVAVMGNGVTFRSSKKATNFRRFVDDDGVSIERLPSGSFKSSGTIVQGFLCLAIRGSR